jgi:hypothetical protein
MMTKKAMMVRTLSPPRAFGHCRGHPSQGCCPLLGPVVFPASRLSMVTRLMQLTEVLALEHINFSPNFRTFLFILSSIPNKIRNPMKKERNDVDVKKI